MFWQKKIIEKDSFRQKIQIVYIGMNDHVIIGQMVYKKQ